jgi:N-acyl-D-amino-acid deacylase
MTTLPFLLAWLTFADALPNEAYADPVKRAIERALPRIEQGAAAYTTHRTCFSCHHQATAILSLTSARARGFPVAPEKIKKQLDFTLDSFKPDREKIAKGQGVPGGNTQTAYALFALNGARHPADETTKALIEFLLLRQKADGSWPALANRPPTEGSALTNAALALYALRAYAPAKEAKDSDELRERIDKAIHKGRDWLLEGKPATTEDQVGRLRGLVWAGAEKEAIETARAALVKEQREDGSWAQLADLSGDAYATGTVLMALRCAGLLTTDPAYEHGVQYLVKTQKLDGSWIVQTRSRPVQVFFDNGDPGDKSQFISFAATGWATLALLERYPVAWQRGPLSFVFR